MEQYADQLRELVRYYQVGIVNTIFGFGLYTAIVFVGANLFAAQLASHICGMVFNYFMFRHHVFKSTKPNILSYVGSYTVNYVISLALLSAFHRLTPSPYLAGFLTVGASATLNYFMLKRFVFRGSTGRKQ